jgi:hypothetical protein
MVIREDETLSSIKERLQKKLKVSDEDFSKVIRVYPRFLIKYRGIVPNIFWRKLYLLSRRHMSIWDVCFSC